MVTFGHKSCPDLKKSMYITAIGRNIRPVFRSQYIEEQRTVWFSNGHLVLAIWILDKFVQYSDGLLNTWPFDFRTLLDHSKTGHLQYLNTYSYKPDKNTKFVFGFQMFGTYLFPVQFSNGPTSLDHFLFRRKFLYISIYTV